MPNRPGNDDRLTGGIGTNEGTRQPGQNAQTGGSVLSADGKSYNLNAPEGVAAVKKIMEVSRTLGDPNIGPTVPGEIHTAVASGDQTCGLAGEWLWGASFSGANTS